MPEKSSRKFDADWVHKVKTDQLQKDWYDTMSPIGVSMILRVSRSGSKTWFARYRPQGESVQRRFKIGAYPAMPLSEARAKVSAIHAGLQEGVDPAGKRKADREAMTFGDIADLYIERYAMVRKKSWKQDKWLLGKELEVWSKRPAHLITKRDVIDLLHEIHDRPAPVLSNRTLALARKIFNWAISQDLVKSNPCDRVPAVGKEERRERALTDDEIRKVWAVFSGDVEPDDKINPLVGDILKIMLITGQRRGEIERMRWADLDLDDGWWTIPSGDAKNRRSHRVPLAGLVLDILEARRSAQKLKAKKRGIEPPEWVFPGRGVDGPITESKKSVANAQKVSKVDDWAPHDLRRTVASNLGRMGVPPSTIARCLNHKDSTVPDVTWTYIQYQFDQEKRVALDAWATRLAEILAPRRPAVLQSVVPVQSPAIENQGSAERRRPTTPRRGGTRKAPSASPRL